MRGKKSRLAAGVAAAGAVALLAACSPVKMGSAAIVGNERITQASLSSQVSSVQQTLDEHGLANQVPAAELPRDVLNWQVRFAVMDRVAQDAGITVGQGQIQDTLNTFNSQEQQAVEAQGQQYPGLDALLALNGIAPDQRTALGKYLAQETALEAKAGSQAAASSQLQVATCKAVRALNIQVNPQYGQLNYQVDSSSGQAGYLVTAAADTLSRPAGKASPAPTQSAKQPC